MTLAFVWVISPGVFYIEILHRWLSSEIFLYTDLLFANECLNDGGWTVALSIYYVLWISEVVKRGNCAIKSPFWRFTWIVPQVPVLSKRALADLVSVTINNAVMSMKTFCLPLLKINWRFQRKRCISIWESIFQLHFDMWRDLLLIKVADFDRSKRCYFPPRQCKTWCCKTDHNSSTITIVSRLGFFSFIAISTEEFKGQKETSVENYITKFFQE